MKFIMRDDRFWEKVDKKDSGCWEWTGATIPKGYGKLKRRKRFPNKDILAHRYSWYLKSGIMLTSDIHLCHKCDNRLCVNPKHLFKGDAKTNMQDMWKKKRGIVPESVGEQNGNSTLKEDDIFKIRQHIKNGLNNKQIAKIFNVSHSNISLIRRNKIWKHI